MAIITMEGFDHFPTDTIANASMLDDVSGYTVQTPASVSINDTIMHHDQGKSLRQVAGGYTTTSVGDAVTDTIYLSFGLYVYHTNTSLLLDIFKLLSADASNYNVMLQWAYDGALKVYNPLASLLYTSSTGLMQLEHWYWIEAKIYMHDTAGTVEVWIDGNKEVDLTTGTRDTKRDTVATVSGVRWGTSGSTGVTSYFDNMVVQDDAGAILGDSIIETFMPSGDATVAWSQTGAGTNAADVADTTTSMDTNYVYSNNIGDVDLYDVGALSADDTVHAVAVQYRAQKTDTGVRAIQSRTYADAGGDNNGGASTSIGTSWVGYEDIFETTNNEETDDVAWTKALFDAAQFGIKVTV